VCVLCLNNNTLTRAKLPPRYSKWQRQLLIPMWLRDLSMRLPSSRIKQESCRRQPRRQKQSATRRSEINNYGPPIEVALFIWSLSTSSRASVGQRSS
jgi:hypothetical protein